MIDYRAARTSAALRRSAANFLVTTGLLVGAIVASRRLSRWGDRLLARRLQPRIQSVGIQSFELIRAERLWTVLQYILLVLKTVALVAIGTVYLGFALAQFPWTRGFSREVVAFVIEPLEVVGLGLVVHFPSLIFLVVLFYAVRLALRVVRLFFDATGRGAVTLAGFDPEWADPTYKILRAAVVAFALVVAFPYIPGSHTDAFKGISLFIGIVVSLGSSSVIANIAAGYMMTYRRALKVGDRVKIGNAFGDVIHARLQVTHLRSVKNEEIIIPNSQILSTEVVNFSSLAKTQGLILHAEVGIGYDVPWRQVEALLLAAADRTMGLSKEPRPFVLEKRLGDFAVSYEINAYCGSPQAMGSIYADLYRHTLDVFNEYGVQIMTPAYEGDPSAQKVVPPKDWHRSPAAPARGPTGSIRA